MSTRRSNASPGSCWEAEEDDRFGGCRSSAAPSSASASPRRHPHHNYQHSKNSSTRASAARPEHFDDANHYHGDGSEPVDAAENFKVFIRVRPPVTRELQGYRRFVDVVQLSREVPGAITLCDAVEAEDYDGSGNSAGAIVYSRQGFTFDYVYDPRTTQDQVYDRSARPAVLSVLEGYNATLIAYGQTGTGKTYTMEGFTNEEQRGIIPRSVEEIFDYIRAGRNDGQTKFLVRASYMQIYNEVISDLLVPPGSAGASGRALTVRHTPQRGVYIDGLSEWVVRNPRDVYGLIEQGTAHRATSATKMSELSSRSHAIFTIVVEVLEGEEESPIAYRFGKLNIVDLAGSEKVRQSGVSGQRLEETKKINRSLHELGNVISALATKSTGSGSRAKHIPFRNSVLTSALRDSLGGNCKTTLIACISPALESYTESLSTLMFANRAKNIRTNAVVNEDMDQAMLLRKYEKELQRLRELLHEQQQQQQRGGGGGGGGGGDTSFVSELEEGRQRAEEDRQAALAALQQSSQTCQQLEQRIRELETMMDEGGFSGTPRTSDEYAMRLQELDRERLVMEEDKAQVDRYKQLLLKQRDIMLNLTTRLNERDETILQLQEEIDAYDAHVELLEGQLSELLAEEVAGGGGGATDSQRVTAKRGTNNGDVSGLEDGAMTRAEAEQYLRRCRVAPTSSAEPPRYQSDLHPSMKLSAEEKLLEVLQRVGTAATAANAEKSSLRRSASPLSPLSSQLRLTDAEVAQLKDYVRQRAESAALTAQAARAEAAEAEVSVLALQLAASEGRAGLYERCLRPVGGHAPSQQQQQQKLIEELAQLERTIAGRTDALLAELQREKEERRRVAHQLERLRFEVEQQQEAVHVTPAHKAAFSRLWQALQALEQELTPQQHQQHQQHQHPRQLGTQDGVAAVAKAKAAKALSEAVASKEKAWQRVLEEKQAVIDQLQQQNGGIAASNGGGGDELAAAQTEMASLQRELTIQKKDRRALKTILEQRMRSKVERICELIDGGAADGQEQRLAAEAKSLQTLLNASIKAMDS